MVLKESAVVPKFEEGWVQTSESVCSSGTRVCSGKTRRVDGGWLGCNMFNSEGKPLSFAFGQGIAQAAFFCRSKHTSKHTSERTRSSARV